MICTPASEDSLHRSAHIHHANLYGLRDEKERVLSETDVSTTEWLPLSPEAPLYLFAPQDASLRDEYQRGWGGQELFEAGVLGFQTHRDPVAVAFTKDELRRQVEAFCGAAPDPVQWREHAVQCAYRPFDTRWVYLHKSVTDRSRWEIMRQMIHGNVAVNLVRQTKARDWRHALASSAPAPAVYVELKDGSTLFPLYIQTGIDTGLFAAHGTGARRANLSPAFIQDFSNRLGMEFISDGKGDRQRTWGPEDAFSYMYAVFHAPTYRARYAEFLKMDFPRLPLTSNPELFQELAALGDELVALHLMEASGPPIATFPNAGDNVVEQVRYSEPSGADTGRVWINRSQFFEGVPPEVWEFHVGGYQVCEKWLKDRKGRTLTFDDLTHYTRVVSALSETIRLMAAVDETIQDHGGWPMQ